MPRPSTALAAAILFAACGAPEPAATQKDCTSFGAKYPQLIALLQSPDMQPVVEVVQTQLLDAGLLTPAVSAVIDTLGAAPPPPASVDTEAAANDAASAGPSVLRSAGIYVVGYSPASTAHYEVTAALGDTLSECQDLLPLIDGLLNTPVPAGCSLGDSGCDVAWHSLSVALRAVVATPSIRDLLGSSGGTSLSEDDFVGVIKTLTAYFKSTDPDFSIVNTVVQSDLLSLVTDPTLHDALQNLLTTLEEVLSPALGIQAALASSLTCFEDKDSGSSVYHMLYALLGDASFQTTEIVASTSPAADTTVVWIGQLTHYLRDNTAATTSITNAIAELLTQDNASIVLPALINAADAGVFVNASQLLTPQPCPQ